MYTPFGEELFGIEIYNDDLADKQRQLFDIVWAQFKILNEHGEAVVDERVRSFALCVR